jgi:GntR family transcriptional repressor for pyruvate dehydrogenase complex
MIKPARKKNLYEEISKQIISLISNGHWNMGTKIPTEMELSKEFQVSRNSIREAIKALELVGLLTSKTGIGTFVSDHALANIQNMQLASIIESESTLIELMETRLIIEPGIVEIAAHKATNEDLLKLEKFIKLSEEAVIKKQYTFDKGFLFHKHVLEIADNKVVSQFMNNITAQLLETRKIMFFKSFESYNAKSEIEDHIEILTHMKNKNAKLARDCMYKHLLDALTILKQNS